MAAATAINTAARNAANTTHTTPPSTPINRSNSFASAFKWLLHSSSATNGHHHQQQNNNNHLSGSPSSSSTSSTLNSILLHIPNRPASANNTYGSSVAVQKLRESKWFKRDEQRIFCAVVECGFIVEVRTIPPPPQPRSRKTSTATTQSNSSYNSYGTDLYDSEDDDDDDNNQDENDAVTSSWFGIVLCKTTKECKAKPETIEIHSVKIGEKGSFKKIKMSLEEIWSNGMELRINNFGDKEKQPHNEKDIRNQVSLARKATNSLWNNNRHFAYWCRYGIRQQDMRKRHMSECVKWGSVGMNAGILLVMNKQKSYSTSK